MDSPEDPRSLTPESARLHTAHVVFADIVGYSLMATDEQNRAVHQLQSFVRELPGFAEELAAGDLICIPTGDGVAIVCFGEPTAPVRYARDLAVRIKLEAPFGLRMGLHNGPVYASTDINANRNVAGGGINVAQRVMDCGDTGHILLSQSVADTLRQLSHWRDAVQDLGECEVKHGLRLRIFNLSTPEFGNPVLPSKIGNALADAKAVAVPPPPDTQSPMVLDRADAAIPHLGRHPRPAWIAWSVAAVLAMVAAVAFWAPWRAEKQGDRPLLRLDVDLGADVSLPAPTNDGSTVAISTDGTRLAYLSGEPVRLFTRALDQTKATELPGTQGASTPFFSPDGRSVGFFYRGRLNKISVAGGAVVPLGYVGANFAGASWGEDGSIFVSLNFQRGLLRIPAGGGLPETVAGLGDGEVGFDNPQILPGGKAVLFSVKNTLGSDRSTIEILTLADRHRKIVARGGSFPRYMATSREVGHLVYVNKGTLFAIPFDLAKLETRGTAVPVLDDVAHLSTGPGQFDFSWAPSGHGTLVYRRASDDGAGIATLQWVAQDGKIEPLRAKPGAYSHPRLSPDGKRVTLTIFEGGIPDVWVYDPQRDAMTRLTFGGASYRWSAWSPDGQYVVLNADGNGIFQARADGAGQPQALTQGNPFQFPYSFTPDGKRLAYFETDGTYQIWTVPLEEMGGRLKAGKPEQFLKSSFNDTLPSFAPDGRFLAYQSDESGSLEVYVRAFPPPSSGRSGKWQISNSGGTRLRWSRNGHELLYQSGDQIMAASYTVKGDTFVAERSRVWLAKIGGTAWDLAPDGKRVLVLKPVESAEGPKQEHEVVFLENFFDELRRKVPVGK